MPDENKRDLFEFAKKVAAVLTALSLAFGFLWATGKVLWATGDATGWRPIVKYEFVEKVTPIEQQVAELLSSNLQVRWWQLNEKRLKGGGLTFLELQEFCKLSTALGYRGIPECGI